MACPVCTAELDPIGERRHEEHYGIRFEDWNVLVFKASEMLPDCYEVDVREGRAWRYVWPTRFCECGNGAAAYIDTGRFEVRPSDIETRPCTCGHRVAPAPSS